MAIAGQIEYQVSVDTSGLKKGLNEAKKETSAFSSNLVSIGKTGAKIFAGTLIAGATASAGAIAGLTASAVKSFASFEQLSGGIEAMFGGIEKGQSEIAKVNELANNAWKNLTMSQNEYYESFASSYPLMKADMADQNEAIEATNRLLTLNSDLANTFGYSMETASNAINWALKGSFNYLDNLNIGIKGTKEGFLETAQSLGYMVDSVDELKSEDILAIIEKQAEKFGVLGRTGEEAYKTITGSLNMTKSAWQNLLTGMADDGANFDQLVENFTTSITAFGKNIVPRIGIAVKGAVKALGAILPEIAKMLPDIIQQLLPAVMEATKMLITALVQSFPIILQVLLDSVPMIVQSIYEIFGMLIQALPEILVMLTQIIVMVAQELVKPENLKIILNAFVELLWGLINAIPQIITALAIALPDIITSIIAFLTDPETILKLVEASVVLFMALVMALPQILQALFIAFGNLFRTLWEKLTKIFTDFAGNFGEKIGSVFKGAINHVLEFIEGFVNAPIDLLNSFIETINNAFGSIGVNLGHIGRIQLGRMATGGIVPAQSGGHLILAGEGGQDEWVVPESKMASMIQQINEQGGTGGGITINIQGVFATSEQEQRAVAEQIYDRLQEINKTRMGAYL